MNHRSVVGSLSRRLPRGRGHIGRWIQQHPGAHEVTFRDISGHRRTLDLRDELSARWFAGERAAGLPAEVLSLVAEGDAAVDVGANIGIITGQLAAAVGPTGAVHAFEPVPANIYRLEQLCRDNELTQVTVHPCAAGEITKQAELRLPGPRAMGHASFTATWIDQGRLVVDVKPLDALPALSAKRISFMKIDVEGYEGEVLTGARSILARDRPLLYVEVNHAILKDRGSSGEAFIQDLETQYGYSVAPFHRGQVAGALSGLATLLMVPSEDQLAYSEPGRRRAGLPSRRRHLAPPPAEAEASAEPRERGTV